MSEIRPQPSKHGAIEAITTTLRYDESPRLFLGSLVIEPPQEAQTTPSGAGPMSVGRRLFPEVCQWPGDHIAPSCLCRRYLRGCRIPINSCKTWDIDAKTWAKPLRIARQDRGIGAEMRQAIRPQAWPFHMV